jgi:hypothetical protein
VTKRQQVEAYLATRSADELARLTAREVAGALTDQGMDVSERYVGRILDAYTAAQRSSRKRGSR